LLKALSGLFINLSAAGFGAAFIVPNFSSLKTGADLLVLTFDILTGTIFLILTAKIERLLEL